MSVLNCGRLALTFCLLSLACGCHMSATAHNVDGVRQYQLGQYQGAVEKFRRAISANPGNADAYYNMAATLHDWGRRGQSDDLLKQSEGFYHQCLDHNLDHVECYRALAVLLVDTGRRDSAFTLLERWAARSPHLSDPRIELARLYEELGDSNAARQYLTQALDVDSTSARAWAALGRLRENEGRLAQALTNYQHAYNLNRYQPGVARQITSLQQRVARAQSAPLSTEPHLTRNASQWVPR